MSELTKEKRIEEELSRISIYFAEMDENQRAVIDPIIQNSAFMKIQLDDLQEIINREGVIDHYMNGANQYGLKPSATLQSYNTLVKNYAAVNKTLFSLLPKKREKQLSPHEIYLRDHPPTTQEQREEEYQQLLRENEEMMKDWKIY